MLRTRRRAAIPPCCTVLPARWRLGALLLVPTLSLAIPACGSSSTGSDAGGTGIPVVASINAWGSILAQLGGIHVRSRAIITSPGTDPHS
jgi:zinc/manganese transport system substrate-binding protein